MLYIRTSCIRYFWQPFWNKLLTHVKILLFRCCFFRRCLSMEISMSACYVDNVLRINFHMHLCWATDRPDLNLVHCIQDPRSHTAACVSDASLQCRRTLAATGWRRQLSTAELCWFRCHWVQTESDGARALLKRWLGIVQWLGGWTRDSYCRRFNSRGRRDK